MFPNGTILLLNQGRKRQDMNPVVASTILVGKRIALGVADFYLDFVLRIREGQRAVPRTQRRHIPREVRERVRISQGRRCIYCGVTLNRTNYQVDHIYPIDHGGPDEESNMQATCGSCNSRKGVQTDQEFRHRYRSILPSNRQPPTTRIPQARFTAITQNTTQARSTIQRRRAVYVTPAKKIVTGSLIGGGVLGVAWLIGITSLPWGESVVAQNVALWGGLAIAGLVALGLIGRAKRTGRMEDPH